MEDSDTWVTSKLLDKVGALRVEAFKLKNGLLRFSCASKKLKFKVPGLTD